ncbi:unnamed protein product [Cylicostephanus goldi]|uniref:Tyrosinase copper-binding domain-containing protein n=1 Tax=Cylicostephanus goldi TaxID=71465 RepID=A0A3P7M3Y8_CYLGO|nr:unnamed protein product [Cylicostephanus goldi]
MCCDAYLQNLENASVVPSEKRSFNTPPQSVYECFNMTCVCGFMGGSMTSGSCRLKNGMTVGQTLRKEYRMLTDDERSRFHKALWSIKNSGVYDYLNRIHTRFAVSSGAHAGPAFVPWHREFLKRVEIALRMVDPSMALTYWDSTMDSRLTKPEHSVLWSSELLGGSKPGEVKDGPFAGWMLESKARVIKRDVGKLSAPMPIDDVQTYMSRKDMVLTASSANDPTFFLHHSFIDFIWESWRQATQVHRSSEF